MKIKIDKTKCQGHSLCQLAAPTIYELDENGYNNMEPFQVSGENVKEAMKGVVACPEHAITPHED